jgi:hypothetical protein
MRFSSTVLLALPAIAVAEQQIPILDKVKGFFNKATAAVSSSIPSVPSSPINAAAEKAASKAAAAIQHPITLENWKEVLTVDPTASPPTTQDWLIFITGGNTTCFGLCGNATKAWNVSIWDFNFGAIPSNTGLGISSRTCGQVERAQVRLP